MTRNDVAALHQHVVAICKAHKIAITFGTRRGRAWRTARKVSVPHVRGAISYAVALHEIGHVLGKRGRNRLDHEVYAWQWAEEHAHMWNAAMERKRKRSLQSYVRWAKRRQAHDKRGRTFISADHLIWRYLTTALAIALPFT